MPERTCFSKTRLYFSKLRSSRGRSQLAMCPVRHTGDQAIPKGHPGPVTQGMVIPCSSRLTQHERLCGEPEGTAIIYAILRYSLLMWNNHTSQLLPCLA